MNDLQKQVVHLTQALAIANANTANAREDERVNAERHTALIRQLRQAIEASRAISRKVYSPSTYQYWEQDWLELERQQDAALAASSEFETPPP